MSTIAEPVSKSEKTEAGHPCSCGVHDGTHDEAPSYCATQPGQWVRIVRDFVKVLQFGEVHLTVHKGRVIEVRKIEKVRFEDR